MFNEWVICLPGLLFELSTCIILSAARIGTVLFSTTILLLFATRAMSRAHPSTCLRSAARPLPLPLTFVGVLTEMKINSASLIALSMSFEKKRFRPRHFFTTSSKPGWKNWSFKEEKREKKHVRKENSKTFNYTWVDRMNHVRFNDRISFYEIVVEGKITKIYDVEEFRERLDYIQKQIKIL